MRHACLALAFLLLAQPAWAQLDLVGNWARRSGEDARALGGEGTHIGDYTGMPLTEAGRIRAETWDATVLSQRERQGQPHNSQYYMAVGRVERILDPITNNLIGYTTCCLFGGAQRTIWLDGRPHPPAHAERTWTGFSSGRWNGNVLTVTTTHLRTGYLLRNGTPASVHTTVTEHFIRHGDQLTVVQIVADPAYLEIPLVRTIDFVLNPVVAPINRPERFEIIDEVVDFPKGHVPSYALGTRHTDWADYVGLPWEASRGGRETLFPDYLPTLRKMVRDYQSKHEEQR